MRVLYQLVQNDERCYYYYYRFCCCCWPCVSAAQLHTTTTTITRANVVGIILTVCMIHDETLLWPRCTRTPALRAYTKIMIIINSFRGRVRQTTTTTTTLSRSLFYVLTARMIGMRVCVVKMTVNCHTRNTVTCRFCLRGMCDKPSPACVDDETCESVKIAFFIVQTVIGSYSLP